MAALSKLRHVSGRISNLNNVICGATTVASLLFAVAFVNAARKLITPPNAQAARKDEGGTGKYNVVRIDFLRQLHFLVKIIIPRFCCKETALIALYSAVLLSRTFLSIYVASLEGRLIRTIVEKRPSVFIGHLLKWFIVALPATFINSMIRFMEGYVGMTFCTRLTQHAYNRYLSDCTYYQVRSLDGRLKNVDQCLTDDMTMFCQTTARLYSLIVKPLFDIAFVGLTLIYKSRRRKSGSGTFFPLFMGSAVLLGTARMLRYISPKFGELASEEARRKGQLRFLHSRLITNSEEVAFYGGHEAEKASLMKAFINLQSQTYLICQKRILYVMAEQYLLKYMWSATGLIMIALPIFTVKASKMHASNLSDAASDGGSIDAKVSDRAESFMIAKSLLGTMANAAEKLMSSYKEVIELAGYTSRVYQMFKVFEDVKKQKFVRESALESANENKALLSNIPEIRGQISETNGIIRLRDVPVITPVGDVIIENLNIEIHVGMHLFITGPNGCGKSSLFRILSGLWPLYDGRLERPPKSQMYYLPQRPYMTFGTLREQIIYPDTLDDMQKKGVTDSILLEILETVHLKQIVDREGGFGSEREWIDVLSGGEKQRLGLARIFYHQPQYALLDECTSAISIDIEALIYQAMKEAGFTLLTVSHRSSLWKFHTHLLQYDGHGGYRLCMMDSEILQSPSVDSRKEELSSSSTDDFIPSCSSSENSTD